MFTADRKLNMRSVMMAVVIVWGIYAILTLIAPSSTATTRYNLNQTQINLLRTTMLLPHLLIWISAAFAFVRFQNYTILIKDTPESPTFKKFTIGILLLLLSVIITALTGAIASFYPGSVDVQKASVIARNITTVGLYLLSFLFIFQGSRELNEAKGYKENSTVRFVVMTIIIGLTTAFTWLIFHNDYRTVTNNPLIRPTYYLPDWLIVLTVIIPYIAVWIIGSMAVVKLYTFAKKVPGIIYKQAFLSISKGLIALILLSISLQFLSQLGVIFAGAKLSIILILVYLILFSISIGYMLIARGSRKLSAIEEVN